MREHEYEVATVSRLPAIIGLFCRISSLLQGSFAKETYSDKEPTNRSHPIIVSEPGEGKEIVHVHVCAHVRVCLYVCIRVFMCALCVRVNV